MGQLFYCPCKQEIYSGVLVQPQVLSGCNSQWEYFTQEYSSFHSQVVIVSGEETLTHNWPLQPADLQRLELVGEVSGEVTGEGLEGGETGRTEEEVVRLRERTIPVMAMKSIKTIFNISDLILLYSNV